MTDTEVHEFCDGQYRISTYDPDAGMTFNQYLIDDERPMLVHTGRVDRFDAVSAAVADVVPLDDLAYAFVTHFEGDECGALAAFLDRNPALKPVCSAVTARQLAGFDIHRDPVVKAGGETLDLGARTLEFVDYPAEMHLWNGLVAYEPSEAVLYSSDLFRRRGRCEAPVVAADVDAETASLPADRVPAREPREDLAARLRRFDLSYLAPGHGPVLART